MRVVAETRACHRLRVRACVCVRARGVRVRAGVVELQGTRTPLA